MEKITSKENKKIKLLLSLKKASKRKKENLILIEGKKEISLALSGGLEIEELFCSEDKASDNDFYLDVTYLDQKIFYELSYRETPDGFMALAKRPERDLGDLELKKDGLVLVLENIEKPGNIGAMLRTADAARVDAVIVASSQTDLYNPNVIRSSIGTVFTVPVYEAENDELLDKLKKESYKIYGAALEKAQDFLEPDYKNSSAIVIGTEHDGLSDFWLKNSDQIIKIPMHGQIDSLNASVSAAVILYEVLRQRK